MTILSDHLIRKIVFEKKMIAPFVDKQCNSGMISYGLSSYGHAANSFRGIAHLYQGKKWILCLTTQNLLSNKGVDRSDNRCIHHPWVPNRLALAQYSRVF